ncbi:MAG: DUF3047 domain-containing protein [Burkholderiales bacterium]|nr:DUF3047 domain-containing protein [Burkholderiales bacterium]
MRALAALLPALLAGGAALAPQEEDDGLLASSAVVASRARETGARIEVARFSAQQPGGALPADWQPWIILPSKPETDYRLAEVDGRVALEARAEDAASGLVRIIRVDPRRHPLLEWSWRVPALPPGADPRVAVREDAAARLIVSFHGDREKLDFADRAQLRLAKALSGQGLPYATLMYVWANDLPRETLVRNPHTARVRMIVVESGKRRLGEWVSVQRNLLEDYRRAFGEDPWDVVAIGVMTDTDNTRSRARAYYGDIVLHEAP